MRLGTVGLGWTCSLCAGPRRNCRRPSLRKCAAGGSSAAYASAELGFSAIAIFSSFSTKTWSTSPLTAPFLFKGLEIALLFAEQIALPPDPANFWPALAQPLLGAGPCRRLC